MKKNNLNKTGLRNMPKPEIRDNLDSRINEEQKLKGEHITSNKKELKNDKPKKRS